MAKLKHNKRKVEKMDGIGLEGTMKKSEEGLGKEDEGDEEKSGKASGCGRWTGGLH